MACEAERQRVKDLLQQIKDLIEINGAGLMKYPLSLAYGIRYGADTKSVFMLNQDLQGAQADLAACELADGVESVLGKLAGKVVTGIYKFGTT